MRPCGNGAAAEPRQGDASNQTIAEASLIEALHGALEPAALEQRDDGLHRPEVACLSANGLVALTGPSGSGKTTLIDRFCGLLNEGQLLAALGRRHLATERAGRGAADASADCLCPSERGAV